MRKVFLMLVCAIVISTGVNASAEMVYVTKNGKKYHSADCVLIKKSLTTPMEKSKAEESGHKPCGKCMKVADLSSASTQAVPTVKK